jgi:hypothetical protein
MWPFAMICYDLLYACFVISCFDDMADEEAPLTT